MKSETVLVRKLAVGGIVSLLLLAGCGGGTSPSSINQPTSNTPTITTISPKLTVEAATKFVPLIVSVKAAPPATVLFGEIVVIVGVLDVG